MNTKNLTILAIFTLVIVIAAAVITQQSQQTVSSIKQEKFFPDLSLVINDVTEIHVSTKDETMTLIRSETGQWQLKEKNNYPADLEKVRKLLIGAINLTILEAKTANPELYSKIGVEDISAEDAKSSLLTLKAGENKTVASVIVGNDKFAKIDSSLREIYVRKPAEETSWLVLGQLPVEKQANNWLNKQIVDVDKENIRKVSVNHPGGDSLVIFKDSPEDEDYQIADLPANAEIKEAYKLNSIANTLNSLNLDDIKTADEIEFDDNTSTRAKFTSFDGLEVTMTIMEKDDKHYAKFVAAFNQTVADESPVEEESDESENTDEKVDAKQQAETLNAKLKGWVYELSKYKVDNLEEKRDDLISVDEEPSAKTEVQAQPEPRSLEEILAKEPSVTEEQPQPSIVEDKPAESSEPGRDEPAGVVEETPVKTEDNSQSEPEPSVKEKPAESSEPKRDESTGVIEDSPAKTEEKPQPEPEPSTEEKPAESLEPGHDESTGVVEESPAVNVEEQPSIEKPVESPTTTTEQTP